MQIAEGATGITASTLKETAFLLEGGIKNITLAYPLVTEDKLEIFEELRKKGSLETIVLNEAHGQILNTFFEGKKPLSIWLKVDTGLHRLGVAPKEIPETLLKLEKFPNLKITGLLTHGGHSYKGGDLEKIGWEEGRQLTQYKKEGLKVSCGSTPTAKWVMKVPGVDEIRPGNYVFYDNTMISLGVCAKEDCALTIKTTIIGVARDHLVMDAGSKTLGLDQGVHGNAAIKGFGRLLEDERLSIPRLSEEHGIITGDDLSPYQLGDRLTIIPNHACAAVNLADEIQVFKGKEFIEKYKIIGRGH